MTETSPMEIAAYQHKAKPEWGPAVIAWDRDGKRGYVFEDGEIRVLKDGYYHLMVETDVPAERLEKLMEGARRVSTSATPSTTTARERRGISFDEQFEFFLSQFPEGFDGEKWKSEHRAAKGRALKRHRDPAMERAAKVLAADALDASDDEGVLKTIKNVAKLFASTDLVPAAQAKTLNNCDAETGKRLLSALRDLLWSDDEFPKRFETWLGALRAATGESPTWMLATFPLAITHPQEHVCVRPTAFRAQASSLAPRLQFDRGPNLSQYERVRTMVARVRERATERGFAPADLLDVHDFIKFTLSPKSRKAIAEGR